MKTSDLPLVVFSRATFKAERDGIFVFTGATSTITIFAGIGSAADQGEDQLELWVFKNRGSGNLTIATTTGTFYDTASVATLTVLPGGFVWVKHDGSFLSVIAKG